MSADKKDTASMEKLVSLCKRRGFIYQSSEIYGGIGGFWDYGPLGAELKRNLREAWWRTMTRDREDVVGLDATIIMHPKIWEASGHTATFADLMRECTLTNKRVRADHVDPQSGTIIQFSGAQSPTGWKIARTIQVLIKNGEHIESFRKRVRQLIAQNAGDAAGKPEEIELLDETKLDTVEISVDFHPESGAALGPARPFNLMLKTYVGPTATEADVAYLRPETAQAIFAQFKNVLDSSRVKVPFGICQIGKAFRNEVTPKNFTFRSREFEQMELEFFIKPDEAIEIIHGAVAPWSESADLSEPQPNWGWEMWHRYWVDQRTKFYASIGLGTDVLDYYWQTNDDLAHYARACVDILFKFPFGTEELEGIAARGDFDLSQHQKHSGRPQEFFDDELKAAAAKLSDDQKEALIQKRLAAEASKTKGEPLPEPAVRAWFERLFKGNYVPHVIEPSAGLDRLALAVLSLAYNEVEKTDDKGKTETLTIMRFHPSIAPIKVGVFPLVKNKPEIVAKARSVYNALKKHLNCFYDETASIGRRYARQDEAGTPFGVTIDFDTLGEKGPELLDTVTVRERDSAAQHRVPIADLLPWLLARI
ncbi:glycine--tRNA ligase [Phragmitibacter flavus]|uniref:Glycine--tRNA ligase n=1 Tax=Phragmitibacter flavus TaxID=2576071 RepID=A0A5R8KDN1_9BACT|nr:glycine--tRNA ligase [Phragmitibacter flavus]TLD70410.1 glycine--tRNA ligase [Phragmitibacter flavus]